MSCGQFFRRKARRGGFTLLELLTVIAIMAVLLALLFPAFSSGIDNARRIEAANKLKQIHLAYFNFSTEGGQTRTVPASVDDPHEWAGHLAQFGGLNTAELYYLGDDPAVAGASTRPLNVAGTDTDGSWVLDTEFSGFPISFAFVSNLDPNLPRERTPLAWTRGLQASGRWAEDSPYGGEGGHIVFMDGRVVFYRDLSEDGGVLRHVSTGARTANVFEAINDDAVVVEWTGPTSVASTSD